jgi:hypothetical protein
MFLFQGVDASGGQLSGHHGGEVLLLHAHPDPLAVECSKARVIRNRCSIRIASSRIRRTSANTVIILLIKAPVQQGF